MSLYELLKTQYNLKYEVTVHTGGPNLITMVLWELPLPGGAFIGNKRELRGTFSIEIMQALIAEDVLQSLVLAVDKLTREAAENES